MKMSAKQANVKNWFRLQEAVWDHPFENQAGVSADKQKLLMLALVKFADGHGERCHPGQTRLAAMSGQSPSSVKRCLKLFKDKGFINVDRRWSTSNAYTISEDNLSEATTMAYLSILIFLARNGIVTPQLSGHIERTLGSSDAPGEVKQRPQSGHGYNLLTTSLNLPKVELPVTDLTDSTTANSFAFASHRAKSDQEAIPQSSTNTDHSLKQEGGAAFTAREAADASDFLQELQNQFSEQADLLANSLAEGWASEDNILKELKLLLCRSDKRLIGEVPERELESIAKWAVQRKSAKLDKPLIAA